MSTDEKSTEGYAPLFSHFLNFGVFLILFVAGCVALIASIHMSGSVEDVVVRHAFFASAEIGLCIFLFLAPTVYYLVKRICNEFKTLFEKDLPSAVTWSVRAGSSHAEEIGYLFSDNTEFTRYRRDVQKMLNDSREKYIALGLAFCLILPLSVVQDAIQRGLLSSMFSGSLFPWSAIEYLYYTVYWIVVFSLLLSVVWMIVTVTRALLNLEKEKPNLHITKSIEKVAESLRSSKQTDLSRAKIGLLDLAFRRFKAGLSPIVNFVLYLSLEIAFVGVFCSVPALAYFLLTKDVIVVWYGLCISSCILSVVVFVIGQYGVWRLWASSKKDILKLLDHICVEETEKCSGLYSLRTSSAQKEAKEVERYVSFVQRLSIDLNHLTTMTYTSSAIFKLVSINFLSFAPLLLEILLGRMWLK